MRKKNSIRQRLREFTYHGNHLLPGLQRWLAELDGALASLFLHRRGSGVGFHSLQEITLEVGIEDDDFARRKLNEMEALGLFPKDNYSGPAKLYGFADPEDCEVKKLIEIAKDVVRTHAKRINAFRGVIT